MSASTVYVVYFSITGHVLRLAKEIMKGLIDAGINAKMFRIEDTFTESNLCTEHHSTDIPIITPDQLIEPDGILFGYPIRFGSMPVQLKTLFDSCDQLWETNALYGKFVGTFLSGSATGSGQETAALSCISFFAHHGMIYVPLGYKNNNLMNSSEEHGATPYGAGTLCDDGSRQPSKLELDLARHQGFEFGKLVKRVKRN